MALKKSELYSSLWKSCDELRGGMDASQYKDYVLTLLFVKYVSDKYAGKVDLVQIPEGGSFQDMVYQKGKADIGDQMNKIVARLFEENGLRGNVVPPDFNDEEKLGKDKEMVDRLTRLIGIFQGLEFSQNRAEGDDLLGDAYEYLMRHFATESGKSKGQFYTPAEVSRIMAAVINYENITSNTTVYDPTCGSGSLLLKVVDRSPVKPTIYGQENDNATKSLAVMNMWMHDFPTGEIWKGNTLSAPHFKEKDGSLKRFDYVVANPPFSYKSWTNGLDQENDPFKRFDGFGIPPEKNGDYAFLLHILKSMKSTGKGAVILPHGVLFRGNAEASIRENLLKRGYLKGIIGLPANLFYGTGIPACILVLDKEHAEERNSLFLIDASKGFIKDGNKNRLREQDIHKIVDVFTRQQEITAYSRRVPLEEIADNEYNLNIPRYIDSQETEDIQDLQAHMKGGIPERDIEALDAYWQVYPSLKHELFQPLRAGYLSMQVEAHQIKEHIFQHTDFLSYKTGLDEVFTGWKNTAQPLMESISTHTRPADFIQHIAEPLLAAYQQKALINPYDMYQHLMDYWAEQIKDDVYLLIEDGWTTQLEPVKDAKGKIKKGEWDSELIPKSLVIQRYFQEQAEALTHIQQEIDTLSQQQDDLVEEHTGEEGLLNEALTDKGKITKASLTARLKEADTEEERELLRQFKQLMEEEAEKKKSLKKAEQELDKALKEVYPTLSENEIKELVIEDKWLASLSDRLETEINGISQRLAQRIQELAERYAMPLPELETQVQALSDKVSLHLEKMGITWK